MDSDYKPLFPLLATYWDKPLAELPSELQARVKKREAIEDKTRVIGHKPRMNGKDDLIPSDDGSNPAWDEEYATRYEGDFRVHWDNLTPEQRRQQVVQIDDHNDPNSLANTVFALLLYLGSEQDGLEGELGTMISNARDNRQSSVAVTLKELSDELVVIVNADIHRSVSDSSLWRELYRFYEKLPNMKEQAKGKDDYDLALALNDVALQIKQILDIDHRAELFPPLDSDAPAAVGQAAPADDDKKSERHDALTTELYPILDAMPRVTPSLVMAELRKQIGQANTCILHNVGDGIQWENDVGELKTLKLSALKERIKVWKGKRKKA